MNAITGRQANQGAQCFTDRDVDCESMTWHSLFVDCNRQRTRSCIGQSLPTPDVGRLTRSRRSCGQAVASSGIALRVERGHEASGSAPSIPFLAAAVWSETIAAPTTTKQTAPAAPTVSATVGRPVFSFRSSADARIAFGPNPDATAGPRRYLAANMDLDFFEEPIHKLAWVLT